MVDAQHDGVTVLVPTRGRPTSVLRLLSRLTELEDPGVPWRVLVVDNNATASRDLAGLRLPDLPLQVVHEPRAGASHARNAGIDRVATGWTALLDDDVVPDHGWLRALVAGAAQDGFDLAGGLVRLDPDVHLPWWLDASLQGFVTALDLGPDARPIGADEYLLTANAIARTELLRELRFDPRLGPRPGTHLTNDDLDLVRRARTQGARIGWIPAAAVTHEAPPERLGPGWLVRRAYQQGRSDRRLHHDEAAGARLGGVRAGWWYLRERLPYWWTRRTGGRGFLVRAGIELVRTVGWWRESVVAAYRGYRRRP